MPTFKLTLQRELILSIEIDSEDWNEHLEANDADPIDAAVAFLEDNEDILADAIASSDLSVGDFLVESAKK